MHNNVIWSDVPSEKQLFEKCKQNFDVSNFRAKAFHLLGTGQIWDWSEICSFGRVNTREQRNLTNLRPSNRTNSHVNRRKRTNLRPVPNLYGTM